MPDFSTTVAPLIVLIVLYLFLPLTALTYYFFRRRRQEKEIERIFEALDISLKYEEAYYDVKPGPYFALAVFYSSVISLIGLTVLFLAARIGFPDGEFPSINNDIVQFPKSGSRLVFGMAFLGAYLWGLQHILRRYSLNDLTPGVYYRFSIRIFLAVVIAFVIFNAYATIADGNGSVSIWLALAFLLGMFPQRGLRWLMDRLPIFSQRTDPSAREKSLEMIEGITIHDRLRLQEEGIDSCYDLAVADFVPLMLKTPYGARELVDWILQAKLCVYYGGEVSNLREYSIRKATDLAGLEDKDIDELAAETTATKSALIRARNSIRDEKEEIDRMLDVKNRLGKFTGIE